MPELPEVETVKQTLQDLIVGKKITDVVIKWPKMIKSPDDSEVFRMKVIGQTFTGVKRRGKFLKLLLTDDVIVSHLRMEGKYRVAKSDEEFDHHTHVFFKFEDGSELRYHDVRKFGTMHLLPLGTEEEVLPLAQLGLEPFSDQFTPNVLKSGLQKTRRHVKTVLLDQTIVVGLGNIYVDEALFKAGIHPERVASTLTDNELVTLHGEIIETLRDAVEKGGSTIRSYVNSQGKIGTYQDSLYVYGRVGLSCKRCNALLEKKVVGGRGTTYCPNCQKKS
ncbi:DNA-formamidopyrimidine glycosylase [Guptibacillus algicola]|uniref:DNA-formamidopyrimidine glycosylase n=1 Tax=Guptibacillus algicola TaxID=225844 RepID=UPI001CD197EC|nr:DNA-formamidopyrimidine glycosylase [Alkalihalobacillus algicola]MCA0986317.1 DNA-formamidopyrimidine glycosylase [Alkalihalobacillus algicola]